MENSTFLVTENLVTLVAITPMLLFFITFFMNLQKIGI